MGDMGDIICAIMNRRKIDKLRAEIEELLERKVLKVHELEALAGRLGRKRHSRGKEPAWVSSVFNDLPPVTIPHHGGGSIKRFTAKGILKLLASDLDRYEREINESNDDG